MGNEIRVEYFGDFRGDLTIAAIDDILKRKKLKPKEYFGHYDFPTGSWRVSFHFEDSTKLPSQSQLEEMLKRINLTSIQIGGSEE
jgi:hypothetical protein